MKIDQDLMESWLAHPLTELLVQRCSEAVARDRELWLQHSYGAGNADEKLLAEFRGKAMAFNQMNALEEFLSEE